MMDYFSESEGFPQAQHFVWQYAIENYREEDPDKVTFVSSDPEMEWGYDS